VDKKTLLSRSIHNLNDTPSSRIWKNIVTFILILYSLIAFYLIGLSFLNAFKTKSDLINNTMGWPAKFVFDNFKIVLLEDNFLRNLFNSVLLVGVSLFLLLAVSCTLSYGIAMFRFKGRNLLQTYFLLGLMFPIQLGLLPLFVIMTKLHLNNSILGLSLVYAANLSFSFTVFSKFFSSFPTPLLESARIDGASEFSIFMRIVLPVTKPVLFTVALLNFVMIWNDFYLPLVFLTKSTMKTLTLGIYTYTADFLSNWNKVFAGVTIALLPIIVIYFFFSERITSGMTSGSIKG
jgi:raffinose/stachyose/melibiose transport system permease protein